MLRYSLLGTVFVTSGSLADPCFEEYGLELRINGTVSATSGPEKDLKLRISGTVFIVFGFKK